MKILINLIYVEFEIKKRRFIKFKTCEFELHKFRNEINFIIYS